MDFRYLVETKNEFNNFLSSILVPHIFHGIKGMLKYAENVYEQIENKKKRGAKINNPGILNIFKKTLDGIKELNNHEIEDEYQRIKMKSNCSDFFDNLIRASFKSYVLFLTWDPKLDESMYTDNTIYEQISIKDFIHKCYIISCEYFRENPEIFIHNRNNKKDIYEIIKNCIESAIKKSLPYNQIIEDYLNIEFSKKNNYIHKEIADVKNMVNDIINNKKYGDRPNINAIIQENTEPYVNVANYDYTKKQELNDFINKELNKEHQPAVIETSSNVIISEPNKFQYVDKSSTKLDSDSLLIEKQTTSIESKPKSKLNKQFSETSAVQTANQSTNQSAITTGNLTRSGLRSKELSELMDNASKNESDSVVNSLDSKMSKTSRTSRTSKTSLMEISSPPPIRKKATDRLDELKNHYKNDVKVVVNKNGKNKDKFSEMESFYESIGK